MDACTRWEVGCLESCQSCGNNEDEGHKDSSSASPSQDPCVSVLSDVSYRVAVCNHFACLLVEPTPDDDCADPNDCSDPSSDSGSVSSSHGSLPAVLLVSKAENSGDLCLSHNLGHWLGLQTLARGVPVCADTLPLSDIVLTASRRGPQDLKLAVPFVAQIFMAASSSVAFQPSLPCFRELLSLLARLHMYPHVGLRCSLEIEILFNHLYTPAFGLSVLF